MRTVFFGLCLIVICSCGQPKKGEEPTRNDTGYAPPATPPVGIGMSPADPVMDTILKLPFIIKSSHYIDSISQHRQGISFMTDTLESTYEIRAGYNGPERFETYYQLSVDKKTLEINVLDPVEGDYVPLIDFLLKNL